MASLTIDYYEKYVLKNDLNVFITCMKIYEVLKISLKLQNFHPLYCKYVSIANKTVSLMNWFDERRN